MKYFILMLLLLVQGCATTERPPVVETLEPEIVMQSRPDENYGGLLYKMCIKDTNECWHIAPEVAKSVVQGILRQFGNGPSI